MVAGVCFCPFYVFRHWLRVITVGPTDKGTLLLLNKTSLDAVIEAVTQETDAQQPALESPIQEKKHDQER